MIAFVFYCKHIRIKKACLAGFFLLLYHAILPAQQQRVVADGTIRYALTSNINGSGNEPLPSVSKTLYLHGATARLDVTGDSLYALRIFDDKVTNKIIVVQQIKGMHLVNEYSSSEWDKLNDSLQAMNDFEYSTEEKIILGYTCQRLTFSTRNGTFYIVYFSKDIVPSVKELEVQFKNIPGMVLQFTAIGTFGKKIECVVTAIDLSPVAPKMFTPDIADNE